MTAEQYMSPDRRSGEENKIAARKIKTPRDQEDDEVVMQKHDLMKPSK